jgi:hypothetical protein
MPLTLHQTIGVNLTKLTLSVLLLSLVSPTNASIHSPAYVVSQKTADQFPLTVNNTTVPLYISSQDYAGVLRVARLLQADFGCVTGNQPSIILDKTPDQKNVVIIGTLGKNPLIESLIKKRKIEVKDLVGKWETTLIQVIEKPFPKVERALIVVGSDKRGTIYGMFDLSEQIGVSPWYWWADVPPKSKSDIYIQPGRFILGEPKVKYRGIFINDEAPALSGWVYAKFGGFNHQFYEQVFELLLRLKANYLWPGMWGKYFGADPENPRLADEYGIVMGSSHCEPLLFNNDPGAGLWNSKIHGPWRYDTNRDNIYQALDATVAARGQYENVYTIGLRGIHDTHMEGGVDLLTQIKILEKAIEDQREILTKYIPKPAYEIPQVFIPYKEVQDYYDAGLKVPDDVTIMWSDDNWGNIRRLPKLTDPHRSGGYGIYYHYDYVGDPRNYKWLNTNQISRVWEQLHLAYEYGVRRIWVVNVGDIKPMEFPISFFLDYAWNPEALPIEKLSDYTCRWAERQFGPQYAAEIAQIITQYTRFNSRRKPELLEPDTYSLTNFREAETIVTDYQALYQHAQQIAAALPAEYYAAFYQLVLHPVEACANLNELYYTIANNRLYAQQGRTATNNWAQKARELFYRDQAISDYYNYKIADGKWLHMMDQTHIGYTYWQQPDRNVMPDVKEIQVPRPAELGVAVEGSTECFPLSNKPLTLPEFDPFNSSTHYLEIFNRGQEPFDYTIQADQPWLSVDKPAGRITAEVRLWLTIDWGNVPKGKHTVTIIVKGAGKAATVQALVHNPTISLSEIRGCFIESNNYVAIEAEHFSASYPHKEAQWIKIPELGRTLSGMTLFPVTTSLGDFSTTPRLDYNLFLFTTGEMRVKVYLSPTLNFHNLPTGLRFGLAFDNAKPNLLSLDLPPAANTNDWRKAVSDNVWIVTSTHNLTNPGKHVLKIWGLDPGIVIQKIVVETGPVPYTYLGPPESKLVDLP